MNKTSLLKTLKYSFYRAKLNLSSETPKELSFKIIDTKEGILKSMEIVHSSYIEKGYTKENEERLRITPYHFLSTTLIVGAYWNDEMIGTMTLILDNNIGLPMDKAFNLDNLRFGNKRLCEISSLAIEKKYRGFSGKVFFPFTRFIWNLAYHYLDVDFFVIAVNPSMYELYEAIYLFEKIPDEKSIHQSYSFANNNPAVGLFSNLKDSFDKFKECYLNSNSKNNLYEFMKKTNSRSDIYPELKYFIENNSSMKSEWLKEFINISPEGTLSLEEINLIARSFGYFSSIQIHSNSDNRRNRIPSYFQIEEFSNVKIVNFSDSGVCIKYSKDFKLDKKTEVSCLIGPYKKAKLIVEKVWESNDGLMGLRVLEFNSEWEKLLIETYRNKKLNKGRESA